jgi:hypothetical protein
VQMSQNQPYSTCTNHLHLPSNPHIRTRTRPLRRRQLPTLLGLPNRQIRLCTTRRVQATKIAIPAQGNDINNQDPHLGGHVFEVCKLDPGPDHEVLLVAWQVGVLEALDGRVSFHVGHCAEEEGHVAGRKEELVAGYAREDGAVCGLQVYALDEEVEPFCCGGAEDA